MAVTETYSEPEEWNCQCVWPKQMVDWCLIRTMNMLSMVRWLRKFRKIRVSVLHLLCSSAKCRQHWENSGARSAQPSPWLQRDPVSQLRSQRTLCKEYLPRGAWLLKHLFKRSWEEVEEGGYVLHFNTISCWIFHSSSACRYQWGAWIH